ncbi:MAG TPA: HAD family phosphatase [Candidatus Sulfotelmatobacter sp.]|nr:HAD family phosphatase [Candidatus Sulfotelmatobacter sp.]
MFRGVVFDLDGVIVDSHPLHKRAWRAFLASVGKDVDESDLDFILEGRRRRDILTHFLGELSDAEVEDYGNRKDKIFWEACADLEPVAGSPAFIRDLNMAGFPLAVATSASRQRTQWTLRQLNLAQCFDVVVTGNDVAQSKPDPAIYLLAAQRLAAPPESLVAVEDSVCGVRSAKSAGLRCFGMAFIDNVDPLLSAGADRVFTSFNGLGLRDFEEIFPAPPDAAPND